MAGAVAEAVEAAGGVLGEAGVRVEVVVQAGLEAAMPRAGLVHVLLNLLVNAGRAMAGRGGVVRIGCSGVGVDVMEHNITSMRAGTGGAVGGGDGGAGLVEIVMADDGPGIAAGVRERLFRAFATGGGAGNGTGGGSGLGLSICKALVESSGGSIGVETVVGEGTSFRIVLPGVGGGEARGRVGERR